MIRMINGATQIDGVLMTAGSGAFSADAETERRLVEAGAAVYTTGAPELPQDEPPADDGAPDYNDMTAAQLREACMARGIIVRSNTSAQRLRELLLADDTEPEAGEDGADGMPVLTPADPVDA